MAKKVQPTKKTQHKPTASARNKAIPLHRYAQPFLTPLEGRQRVQNVGTRMTDYVKSKLAKIPRASGDSIIHLKNVIGAKDTEAIENAKVIRFHAVGDTGHEQGEAQQAVSDAMAEDYDFSKPEKSPALFIHLGDVIYYNNTDEGYHAQFYEPYKKYPGKSLPYPETTMVKCTVSKVAPAKKRPLKRFRKTFAFHNPPFHLLQVLSIARW